MNGIPLHKAAVACALALSCAAPAAAQQGSEVRPGVYTHTIKDETFLQKEGRILDVPEGEAAFAGDEELEELDIIPSFLTNESALPPGMAGNFRGCGVYEGSTAPLSSQPLQSDFERFDRQIIDEIDQFLSEGYAPASVLLHATSMGVPIDRALYAAVRSQPRQAENLYTAALELMAFLPGWTCTTPVDTGHFDTVYNVNDLPDERRVQDVAERYFENQSRLAQFPDWPNDELHMLASTDELLELLAAEQTVSGLWYRPGPAQEAPGANPRDTVLIGLYPDDDQIVIDTPAERIRQWRDAGRERVPVTFFFNRSYQRPVSDFGEDASLEQVTEAFFEDGRELTPVPLFTVGDYHLPVTAEEIEELFDLPERDDIEPSRYQALADDLASNGFSKKPVLVSLLRSGRYRRLAEADRVRVALDKGIEELPVALFYHRLGREPCASPAVCFDRLCDGLVCAGGDPNVCLDPAAAGQVRATSFTAPTGGGGGPPPEEDPPEEDPPEEDPPDDPPPASPS